MAIRIVIDILIAIGAIFALAGTIGILKMPDTYCRMQASTCVATLGTLCTSIGGILYAAIRSYYLTLLSILSGLHEHRFLSCTP